MTDIRWLPFEMELKQVDAEERVIEGYAAVFGNLDRTGDIIEPGAFDDTLRSKRPQDVAVFIGHDMHSLPVGIPLEIRADDKGLYTRTYIFRTTQGDDLLATARELRERGQTLGMSIGYISQDYVWETQGDQMVRRLKKIDLIEYSFAARQTIANPEALVTLVKQLERRERAMPMELKRAIPPHTTPKAPEDTPWDGPREVAEADIEDLRVMCAIVQGEGDRKQDYKLPHHRASDHYVVWRGVAAAGAVLMGARGGVDASEEEIAGAKRHLERHYAQFEKPVPWEKTFLLADLKDYPLEDWKLLLPLALRNEMERLEEVKAGARMRREMRELLAQVEEALRKLRAWADYEDEEDDKRKEKESEQEKQQVAGAAEATEEKATSHRHLLGLMDIELALAVAKAGRA